MKRITDIVIFFKRIGIIKRIFISVILFLLLYWILIPELKFHFDNNGIPELTFDELLKLPKENIPKYIKLKEAVVGNDFYIEQRKKKTNELKRVYYPVFPITDTLKTNAKIIVKSRNIVEKDLNEDSYYFSIEFNLIGEYVGDFLDSESKDLLTLAGMNVDENLFVVWRDKMPYSFIGSIIFFIIIFALVLLILFSFILTKTKMD